LNSALRAVIAVIAALAIAWVGWGMFRSLLRRTPRNVPLPEPETTPADVRITYRCEECGTELLLLRKGSESPPRHCGEAMLRREEIERS
jgi:DNA-directed RNA polymerase subunit RPC12/RpoP